MAQDATKTQDITQEELDEIERLDREATPGPWATRPAYRDGENVEDVISKADGNCNVADSCSLSDASFIAIARTLLPRLARAYRKAEARLGHAHDAANKLHEAAAFAIQDESERGPTIPQLIGWFRDLKSEDDYGMSEDLEAGCKDLEIVLAKLRSAIDPAEQAAALAEVQRRDGLESEARQAYTRGRREAIEEAAKYLRTFDSTAVKSAAWLMEKHETEISK